MLTKHRLWFAKTTDSSWKHILNVDFETDHIKRERKQFLSQMSEQYGKEGARWSLRWTDHGADVRFRTDADAASFSFFFTKSG